MICPFCKSEIPDASVFCVSCGQALSSKETTVLDEGTTVLDGGTDILSPVGEETTVLDGGTDILTTSEEGTTVLDEDTTVLKEQAEITNNEEKREYKTNKAEAQKHSSATASRTLQKSAVWTAGVKLLAIMTAAFGFIYYLAECMGIILNRSIEYLFERFPLDTVTYAISIVCCIVLAVLFSKNTRNKPFITAIPILVDLVASFILIRTYITLSGIIIHLSIFICAIAYAVHCKLKKPSVVAPVLFIVMFVVRLGGIILYVFETNLLDYSPIYAVITILNVIFFSVYYTLQLCACLVMNGDRKVNISAG